MIRLYVLLPAILLTACSGNKGPNKFSDPTIIEIYNLKDRRSGDSLKVYLTSENPVYRREAALAFASVQDSTAAILLGNILKEDTDLEARLNAAFALGQTGGQESVNALIPAIYHNEHVVVKEVFEALGRAVDETDVTDLRNYTSTDSFHQVGQARGMLQLGMRRKNDSLTTLKLSIFLARRMPVEARLAAAFYFARSAKVHGTAFGDSLITRVLKDSVTEVRLAAVSGLKHLPATKIAAALAQVLADEQDYRVRVNAVRVCQSFTFSEVQDIVFAGLLDRNDMVAIAASEVIRNKADEARLEKVIANIPTAKNNRVKANLYATAIKLKGADELADQVMSAYANADTYYKSWMLSALGEAKVGKTGKVFQFLSSELLKADNKKVILTSAATALVGMNENMASGITNADYLAVYQKAIAMGDAGVTGIIARAFTNEKLNYKEAINDLGFLYDARSRFSMPKDIESLQPLENAIAFLEGKERPKMLKNSYNHPINWEVAKKIPVDQKVEIRTSKGTIVIQLLVEEAPGSVVNFVELIEKKYFDGKNFHRVVPNFVIQDGCNRGDGYGSEDYSIRSEFTRTRFVTGSVGMASAGKDTEGTQWFITHCPTPHLDGKYTIFAQTVSGMDVVDKIDVGDVIEEVKLVKK